MKKIRMMLKNIYLIFFFFGFISCQGMDKDKQNTFADWFVKELAFALVKIYKVETLEDLRRLKKDLFSLLLINKSTNKIITSLLNDYETDSNAKTFNKLLTKKKPIIKYVPYTNANAKNLKNLEEPLLTYYFYAYLGTPYALNKIKLDDYSCCKIKLHFNAMPVESTIQDICPGKQVMLTLSYPALSLEIIEQIETPEYESFASLLEKFCLSSQKFLNKLLQKKLKNTVYPLYLLADLRALETKYGKIE